MLSIPFLYSSSPSSSPNADSSQPSNIPFEVDHEAIATRATHMVEILSEENMSLRQELEMYSQRVSKLQKVMNILCLRKTTVYQSLKTNSRPKANQLMYYGNEYKMLCCFSPVLLGSL